MNQPKFKFGDKVCCAAGLPFVVKEIRWSKFYEQYEYDRTVLENALSLFVEPQEKKLYAYTTAERAPTPEIGEVRFFTGELPEKWKAFMRLPEYDLEFPEAK